MTWQPTTITRFVEGFPSSAHTALVETDAGLGYLKAMGGREGPHTLAAEVVATELAKWFGLPTFDWAIIQVDDIDEIPFLDKHGKKIGQAQSGPAFVTRSESGETWGGGEKQLQLLANPEDLTRLVVFDTWVLNCDRYSTPLLNGMKRIRENRGNVFLSEEAPEGQLMLKAMDHTHCFTCGGEWTPRLSNLEVVRDNRLFGKFPEFESYLTRAAVARAVEDLLKIDQATVERIVQHLPNEWEVKKQAADALVDLITRRAAHVADRIESQIWPQRELYADTEGKEQES